MLLATSVPVLGWGEVLLRLGVAAGLGAAVGLERELREREAGFRTHTLVAVGSALFALAGAYGFHDFARGSVDPTRVAAGIVTGIGFLGAGAILRQGLTVRGLTTAATLWVCAAIGLSAGAGYYSGAVITTLIVLLLLWPLRIVVHEVMPRFRPETNRLLVQLPSGQSPGPLIEELEGLGARLHAVEVSHEADRRTVLLEVALPPKADAPAIVAGLSDLDHVLEVRWTD
jgi:putative Mg2+ transporter-C (MgtC) family protein